MNVKRVAVPATALSLCLGLAASWGTSASAQYSTPQERGAAGAASERTRAAADREQKSRERTPPPRPIVPPEGQQQNPALREECAWVGQRIVGLLFRDDPMTGADFLPFYTRFHCPEEHLNKAFACVVKSGTAENEMLADRIAQCWTDPANPLSASAGRKGESEPTNGAQGSSVPR